MTGNTETKRGPRVFVVHRPKNEDISFKQAEEYGTICHIFDGFVELDNDPKNIKHARKVMGELEFSDQDYLLLSGAKILNTIVLLQALSMFLDTADLKVLTYTYEGKYQLHKFSLSAPEDDDE